MADYFGYSFSPDQQKKARAGLNQGADQAPTANEALKVLSLRLPTVLGGNPVTPEELLKPTVGGVGTPEAASAIARILGGIPNLPAPPVPLGGGPVTSPIVVNQPEPPAAPTGGAPTSGTAGPRPPNFTVGNGNQPGPTPPPGVPAPTTSSPSQGSPIAPLGRITRRAIEA